MEGLDCHLSVPSPAMPINSTRATTKPWLVLHVGHPKTGSSSIQAALGRFHTAYLTVDNYSYEKWIFRIENDKQQCVSLMANVLRKTEMKQPKGSSSTAAPSINSVFQLLSFFFIITYGTTGKTTYECKHVGWNDCIDSAPRYRSRLFVCGPYGARSWSEFSSCHCCCVPQIIWFASLSVQSKL